MSDMISGKTKWKHLPVYYAVPAFVGRDFFNQFESQLKEAITITERERPDSLKELPAAGFSLAIWWSNGSMLARIADASLPDSRVYRFHHVAADRLPLFVDGAETNPYIALLTGLAIDVERRWEFWLEWRKKRRCARPEWLLDLSVKERRGKGKKNG